MKKLIFSLLAAALSASACAPAGKHQTGSPDCDATSQTCQTQAGTVGESIKTQNSN